MMHLRVIQILILLVIMIPRPGAARLSEMSDSELKTVRGQQGIDFNQAYKNKPETQVRAVAALLPQHRAFFDQTHDKPELDGANQAAGFEKAFPMTPNPFETAGDAAMTGDGSTGIAGSLLTMTSVMKGVKIPMKLDMEMDMSLDDVFTSMTGLNADLKGFGLQGNIHTKIEGNIMINLR